MKLFQQYILLFLSAAVFVNCNRENNHWPPYFLKCERNVSDFDECLRKHADFALPYLYEGNPLAGLPRLVPYEVKEVTLGSKQSFKFKLYDADVFGYNYINVDRMKWDLEEKHVSIGLSFSNTIRFSGEYTLKGTFKNKTLDSSGLADITFLSGEFTYDMDYTTEKINGYDYGRISSCKSTRSKEYPRFYFTPEEGVRQQPQNLEKFIQDNNIEFSKKLDEDIQVYICHVMNSYIKPVFINFPMQLIFNSPSKDY